MRYVGVPTYAYVDPSGKGVSVHEMRDLPAYSPALTLKRTALDDFDEIASRPEIYGDGAEMNSFKLHEANIVAIFDAQMDYSALRSVAVPP